MNWASRILTLGILSLLPTPMAAQPLSLAPNELWWFRASSEPVDKNGLAALLVPDEHRDTTQPWRTSTLIVGWHGFSDDDMKDVARLQRLTHLWIRKPWVEAGQRADFELTEKGWRLLQDLPKLRVLGISDCDLSVDDFAEIGKLVNLTALQLQCKGSDAGLAKLANLKKLVHVSVNVAGARPDDGFAKMVAEFRDLRDLGSPTRRSPTRE